MLHDSDEGGMEFPKELDLLCCTTEEEGVTPEDETVMHAENTKVLEAPTQEEIVSCPPPLVFDDALLYDEGNDEEENEVSNVLIPSCCDEDNDFVDNFDEFIHVGKRGWDMIRYDDNPMYDIDDPFQRFPLHLSHEVTNNFDIWQQEPDLIQTPRDDLML